MSEKYDPKTREIFEYLGWIVEKTEHYNAFAGNKNDFLGFADFVVLNTEHKRTVAVQVTDHTSRSKRVKKILATDKALAWCQCGHEIMVFAWEVERVMKPNVLGRMQEQKQYAFDVTVLRATDFGRSGLVRMDVTYEQRHKPIYIQHAFPAQSGDVIGYNFKKLIDGASDEQREAASQSA